jgi:uncharacterized protein
VRVPVTAFLLCVVAASACNPPPPDTRDYATRMAAVRAAKDAQFQRESYPVPQVRKASLLPLQYFPVDPVYNVPAVLTPSTDGAIILMPTTTGQPRRERRAGTLEFTLKGEALKLSAFVEADAPDMNHLFVPFRDLTAGVETYEAGRYLELSRTGTGFYELDFNAAFNPYCYYSPDVECPIPPPENRLKVRIEAGEKVKKK